MMNQKIERDRQRDNRHAVYPSEEMLNMDPWLYVAAV